MQDWAELGRAIVGARGRRSLTQGELAALVGVSVKTINTLENGRATGMRASTRAKLEECLQWPEGHVHRLLTGEVEAAATGVQPRDPGRTATAVEPQPVGAGDEGESTPGRQLTVVREEPADVEEENEVLDAIRRDPDLDDSAKAHFLNQYGLLRELSIRKRIAMETGERELLPYVAHGKREEPLDPAEEQRIQAEGLEAVRRNPDSPARDK